MGSTFFVLLLIAVIFVMVYLANRRSRARRQALLEQAQQFATTAATTRGQPVTVKQGNVTVSVTTSAHADDPRFQPMADEIAKAFSSFPPRPGDVAGMSTEQMQAVSEALNKTFGATVPDLLSKVREAAAKATPVVDGNDAVFVVQPPPHSAQAHSAPAHSTPRSAEPAAAGNDPFTAGDIFESKRQEAEASFTRNQTDDTSSRSGDDPFAQR